VCKNTIILQESSLMSSVQDGVCCEGNGNTKICITST